MSRCLHNDATYTGVHKNQQAPLLGGRSVHAACQVVVQHSECRKVDRSVATSCYGGGSQGGLSMQRCRAEQGHRA